VFSERQGYERSGREQNGARFCPNLKTVDDLVRLSYSVNSAGPDYFRTRRRSRTFSSNRPNRNTSVFMLATVRR
jgi:hypothetical protein